jgi:hypothetical protein
MLRVHLPSVSVRPDSYAATLRTGLLASNCHKRRTFEDRGPFASRLLRFDFGSSASCYVCNFSREFPHTAPICGR